MKKCLQIKIIIQIQSWEVNCSFEPAPSICGSEHLIRLLYILPNILLHTKGINKNNVGGIKQCISIIIQFINKNKTKYLIDYNQIENINKCAQSVDHQYIIKANKIAKKYNQKNKIAKKYKQNVCDG
eukprot:246844_1